MGPRRRMETKVAGYSEVPPLKIIIGLHLPSKRNTSKQNQAQCPSWHNPAPVRTWCEVTQAKIYCSGVMSTTFVIIILDFTPREIPKQFSKRHLDITSPRL